MTPAITERQIDHAAFLFVATALDGLRLSPVIYDLLTDSQIDALRAEVCEAVKTSLLFSLMNLIEPSE